MCKMKEIYKTMKMFSFVLLLFDFSLNKLMK